jgi:hypothetical protein
MPCHRQIASMKEQVRHATGRREGMALITTILILMLVGATALATIATSSEELMAGGRSRSVIKSLYAADAGVQLAHKRIQEPRNLTGFSIPIDGSTVESRSRDQTGAQAIGEGGLGRPPSGYSVNIGSGYVNQVYAVDVTASATDLPTTEVQVRLGMLTANSGSY